MQERVMIDASMVIDELDALADHHRERFNQLAPWKVRSRWFAYGAWKSTTAYRDHLLDEMGEQFGLKAWSGAAA